jgi:hypothetical protein
LVIKNVSSFAAKKAGEVEVVWIKSEKVLNGLQEAIQLQLDTETKWHK